MPRPCFLVIDREHPASISTRKLVIETAKFNVITAYSGQEALETLERFPNVNAIIVDAAIRDIPMVDLLARLDALAPDLPTILIGSTSSATPLHADHHLESFQPTSLLELLNNLEPEETEYIRSADQKLASEHR